MTRKQTALAVTALVGSLTAPLASAARPKTETVFTIDFESAPLSELAKPSGQSLRSLTDKSDEVIQGKLSLKGDSQASAENWNEYFHTQGDRFEPNTRYLVSYDYKVLAKGPSNFFYSLIRSASKADYSPDLSWKQFEGKVGEKGNVSMAFETLATTDYYLCLGIHKAGAISIDNIKVSKDLSYQAAMQKSAQGLEKAGVNMGLILLDEADLERAKREMKQGPSAEFYARVKKNADALLKLPVFAPPKKASTPKDRSAAELYRARQSQGLMLSMAVMYRVSGERVYLARLEKEIDCWLDQWKSWTDPFHGGSNTFDIMRGEVALGLGLAYDWTKQDMEPARRKRLEAALASKVLDLYRAVTPLNSDKVWWYDAPMNWNGVCNGGAIIAALAMRDLYPQWAQVVQSAVKGMQAYVGTLEKHGASDEGTGYWEYGARYSFLGMEAAKQAGLSEGWPRTPSMADANRFATEFSPDLRSVNWGDGDGSPTSAFLCLLATKTGEPLIQAYWDEFFRRRGIDMKHSWPDAALALVWRRAAADPELLQQGRTSIREKTGWAVSYDRWLRPNLVTGFKSGDLNVNHGHLDNNSFQIRVKGEDLAVDLGPGNYVAEYFGPQRWTMVSARTEDHNSLLINGAGQLPKTHGSVRRISSSEGLWALLGEADDGYGPVAKKVRRHFVEWRHQAILVVDEVELAEAGQIEWRMHGRGKLTLKDGYVRLNKGKATLCLYQPEEQAWDIKEQDLMLPRPGQVGQKPVKYRDKMVVTQREGASRYWLPVLIIPAEHDKKAARPVFKGDAAGFQASFQVDGQTVNLNWNGKEWRD